MVADRILEHRELGFQVVGFVDDRAGGDHLGYRGLPLLGTLAEAPEIAAREQVDHLYVALPLEEHVKMLDLVEGASRECIDVQGRAGPAAVHRAAGPARGPRRPPGHQRQRRPAAGPQRRRQARARHRSSRSSRWRSWRSPALLIALAHQAQFAAARSSTSRSGMGLDGRAVHGLQVPLDAARRRGRAPARSGPATTTRGPRRSAAGCAASTSTSCRSSGTC